MKFLVFLPLLVQSATAADFYLKPSGGDDGPPDSRVFHSPAALRDAARAFAGKEPVTVHVADGTFYLPETLVFTPQDSGTADHPVVWKAEREGGAVFSGGRRLELVWRPFRDGILQAAVPEDAGIDQLFVNGRRQRMARYPNFDPAKSTEPYQGYAADAISKERAARWADPSGGYIHAMHASRWGGFHYRITGRKEDGTITYEGGWQNNRPSGMHAQFRMVENLFEELDAPGEWYHDAKSRTLYYLPEADADMARATVEVVRLKQLVRFEGSGEKPVRHLTLQGLVFRHAARTFMETREPLLRSDWTIYRGGAVTLRGTEHVTLRDCEFDQPGGNAVFFDGYNRHGRVSGCHIHDTGASGVCFVGDPAAVRDPLFSYDQSQDLAKIDLTPGPKTEDYPADCAVEDCLITGIGRVERQPAGVEVAMAARIAMRDLSIYNCARAGINIGDGCWGGHLIERCDVFDTVLETHDHGSFNSWGRDRFWTSNHRKVSEPMVKANPELPFLDACETTVIRDSRWRCDHGWDIDLDDGSGNYRIENNLMLGNGLKLREGYRRLASNNITVNNGLHPHVWFDDSGDRIRGNLFMAKHAGIGMPKVGDRELDRNFFTSEAALEGWRELGGDSHSTVIAPDFVDAAAGDFRLREGSPALAAGFRNFAMDAFGVKKPSLRAVAKRPGIPTLLETRTTRDDGQEIWLGASVHSLTGVEYSAFGTRQEDGGVQLVEVPAGSAAKAAGLQANDLIQGLNGKPVRNTADLFAAVRARSKGPLTLTIVRHQAVMEVELPQVSE